MAPYALTPTVERGEVLHVNFPAPTNGVHAGSTVSTPSTITSNPDLPNGDHFNHLNGDAPQQNGHANNGAINGVTNGAPNGASNGATNGNGAEPTSPTTFYEKAYTDGYSEGYSKGYIKSHVELQNQPIAIIGMSCRLPGSVSTPDEFWELLARSRTGYSGIPAERFSANRFFHANPGKSGTTNARGGNFLTHDLTVFDAPFFGFTQQEAISLDPQQRLLLECTFESLESAGIPKHEVVGKDVGVFVGGTFSEYEADLFRDPETIPMHQATGCAMAMQSNRISHFFDLRGPSYTVDTACSSSLVALHNACQSIRNGESSMAIAAGVHLNMLPEFWISYSMSRLFGEAGRSFAFDQRGTGYGRGEGCGMILLKTMEQALKDNDPIRAVITGSGINQDGKTPGITMPNGAAQETLIRNVYKNGGMDPKDTGYVEAHGTGTRVGDPIEVGALHNVFGEGRNKRRPLYIGSVKSNIGHLEAAAGIAGVIKTALMLERGFILPNYDFKQPNEKIPFDEWGMKVATRQQPWPLGKKWASVNGFGFGGTNAHVVMTRGPLERKTMKEEIDTNTLERLFLITANDKASIEKTMQNLGVYLEQRPEVFQNDLLSNLAYTLGQRKSFHPWRLAIPASSSVDLVEALSSGKIFPAKQDLEDLRLGWIFTGQGAQWWAMGRELYQQYPVYAASLDKADAHLTAIGAPFSLLEELSKDEHTTMVNAAHVSQPACTAVQLAMVDMLRSWGIRPEAVAGHSSGEIGAAYAAGIINFEDAMTIAYHRGRLIPVLKQKYPTLAGSMMAVGAGKADISPLLERIPLSLGEARIACINSPSSVTVSGDSDAIDELQVLIEAAFPGMFARKLQVDTAYHSHHMNLVAKEYTESLLKLQRPVKSAVRFHSSLLGRLATDDELDASYWVQNLTCAVRFDEAVQSMCEPYSVHKTGVNHLIELGPHAALQGPIKQTLKHVGGAAAKITYSSVLSRKKNAVQTALSLAGTLFVKGMMLDMGAINFPTALDRPPQVLTDLPRYSWNHTSSFYHESRLTKIHKKCDTPRNDIIGVLAPYSVSSEPSWRNVVRLDDLPWLRHHQMQGVTIFPIAGFVGMALEAMTQEMKLRDVHYESLKVKDLNVKAPAMLSEEELELTITLRADPENPDNHLSRQLIIRSWSKTKEWTDHCTGMVSAITPDTNAVDGLRVQKSKEQKLQRRLSNLAHTATKPIAAKIMYEQLAEIGVNYGKTFQGLEGCHASPSSAVAQVTLADTETEMPHHEETKYFLHPTLLEQLITMYWPVFEASGPLTTVHLPSSIEEVIVSSKAQEALRQAGNSLKAYCEPTGQLSDVKSNTLSMFAVDEAGQQMISVTGLHISPILEQDAGAESEGPRELCYKQEWEPIAEAPEQQNGDAKTPKFEGEVVVVINESEKQREMAATLSDRLWLLTGARPAIGSLESMAEISKGKLCIVIAELDRPLLAELNEAEFVALQHLLTSVEGLLWVVHGAYENSSNPNANMISGLSRTVRSEGTLMKFITLDLDAKKDLDQTEPIPTIMDVFHKTLALNSDVPETEFSQRDGSLHTPRIVNDPDLNEYVDEQIHPSTTAPASFTDIKRPLKATLPSPGAFDKLIFEDDQFPQQPLQHDQVEFQVKAFNLSSKDAASDSSIGFSCSGIVTSVGSSVSNLSSGDRIAAITPHGSLSTVARAQSPFLFKLPDHISFESAAGIPVAYSTASYALIEQARLGEGENVLIHDAGSAVGSAALELAQMINAQIWTTVNTAEEKHFLMQDFGLPEDRIWHIGSEAWADEILDATSGHGIDVVFNTLSDASSLRASGRCLANFGRLVNAGAHLERLHNFSPEKNITTLPADIFALATHRPRVLQQTLAHVARLLRYGRIQAQQQVRAQGITSIAEAVRNAQDGKAVILLQDDDLVLAPRIETHDHLFREDGTYVLIGGTGGLGRSMATWMVGKGAKNIVLLSRSGAVKGKAKDQVDALNNGGANIVVRSCNVADPEDVNNLISQGLAELPPVRGIIHGAMVLHDVLFEKMQYDQYTSVIESKVKGATNFQNAVVSTGVQLDFFVVISSAAGAVGNRGQAAYAAANTFLNGFAQQLMKQGIRAASLDLTAVSDTGYLAEDAEKAAEVARNLGGDTICEAEVLALIQAAVEGKLQSCNGHPITGMRITPTQRPFWSNDAKFVHLLKAAEAASSSSATTTISWSAAIKATTTRADSEKVVTNALVEKIAEVISMEPEELDTTRALSHYPLDSLTAIEVRNFITRMFEANLQVLELLASGSIESLAKVVCTKSKLSLPEA